MHRNDAEVTETVISNDFAGYQQALLHKWLRTVTALVFCLVPVFFVLDMILLPAELIPRFALYRGVSTALALAQFLVVRRTTPSPYSYLHGYFASVQVGAAIALMTVDLGGFTTGYYVGLILVLNGVSLVLPWRGGHVAANALLLIAMYLGFNLARPQPFEMGDLINNLFFLVGAGIIAVSIAELRYRLIANEFALLVKLKYARDSLWGEMELARDIQMSLLPKQLELQGYEIAANMEPAQEVGGDYYEVVTTPSGARYVAIGDVAGHGLSAGLIMMMAQTSLMTILKSEPDCSPSRALQCINNAIRENVGRLGSHHYMTMSILKLRDSAIEVAGHHQDILIYRAAKNTVEVQPTTGTWLGITDEIEHFVAPIHIPIGVDDRVLLFTDGLTEAQRSAGDMFGQERLLKLFAMYAAGAPAEAAAGILGEIRAFQAAQHDDMTMLLIRKLAPTADSKPSNTEAKGTSYLTGTPQPSTVSSP
jgi:serine phosphatase RsbU (regulator of sigma subunit)